MPMFRWFGRALAATLLLVAAQTAPAALAQDGNLIVAGKVPGGTVTLSPAQLQGLPQHELTEQPMSFPSAGRFRGPLLADVLKLAGADTGAAMLTALDDYKVTITADEMASHNPILALELDGVTLAGHDFGPYFVMWPFKEKPEIDNEAFQAKAIWQVIRIDMQ
jgi:hypothetical protein